MCADFLKILKIWSAINLKKRCVKRVYQTVFVIRQFLEIFHYTGAMYPVSYLVDCFDWVLIRYSPTPIGIRNVRM